MADLYELGDKPPLGEVPARMHAYLVRQSRFGQPREAWKREVVPTPAIGPDEVLMVGDWPERDMVGAAKVGIRTRNASLASAHDPPGIAFARFAR